LVYEAIGPAATPGLLYPPRVIVKMIVEKQMECRLAGETEVLGENLLQRHFFSITKSHMTRPVRLGVTRVSQKIIFFLIFRIIRRKIVDKELYYTC
jgi:hypothetical protein